MGSSEKAKEQGGLGVVNLSVQNNALLLKQLDKFYGKAIVQWVRLIWKKIFSECSPSPGQRKRVLLVEGHP
jgi:hypothetical protein